MRILDLRNGFDSSEIEKLITAEDRQAGVDSAVAEIVADVRNRGDAALCGLHLEGSRARRHAGRRVGGAVRDASRRRVSHGVLHDARGGARVLGAGGARAREGVARARSRSVADVAQLRGLGWSPRWTLEEGLRRTIAEERNA